MQATQIRKVATTRWPLTASLPINIHGTWLCIISPLCILENILKLSAHFFWNISRGPFEEMTDRYVEIDEVKKVSSFCSGCQVCKWIVRYGLCFCEIEQVGRKRSRCQGRKRARVVGFSFFSKTLRPNNLMQKVNISPTM